MRQSKTTIRLLSVTLLVLSLPLAVLPVAAEPASVDSDWPQWRGRHRDATSPENGLIDRWPESGPEVLWRSTAGAGYSAVVIADGRLYTLGDQGDAQLLMALDATSGEALWSYRLGATFRNSYGNGPRSTPLIDGRLVYAVGTEGHLVAVDRKSGKVAWKHDLVREFGASLPTYGFSSSPLIVGDKLFLEVGGTEGIFMAFRKGNGKVVWSSQQDRTAYSSPIAVTIHGVEQIVFWSATGLHALSPADGSLLWKRSSGAFCPVSGDPLNTGTPIFLPPDRIFISSGSGATMLRVDKRGEGLGVESLWETEQMKSDVNAAVRVGEFLYGFNKGILTCLDAGTGEARWKARGFERGSLIAADNKLIVLGANGKLALVEATPEAFVQRDIAEVLEGRNWTAPSLAAGKLYLRNHEQLLCLDLKK